jgi:hypothetical protein
MKIESEKHRLDAHRADLSGSRHLAGLKIEKASPAGASIVNTRHEGAAISGVAVIDPLAYWQTGRGAKGA